MQDTTAIDRQDILHRQFATLLEQHRGIVLKIARTYCRHDEDRRDLVQDISTELWLAFARYDASRNFSTWMYRIALNVAISDLRKSGRRRGQTVPLDEEAHGIAVAVEGMDHETVEALGLLQRFIEQLDPLSRALLLLYLDDRSQRETAEILGISPTNVATKIGRLKQRLREQMA